MLELFTIVFYCIYVMWNVLLWADDCSIVSRTFFAVLNDQLSEFSDTMNVYHMPVIGLNRTFKMRFFTLFLLFLYNVFDFKKRWKIDMYIL